MPPTRTLPLPVTQQTIVAVVFSKIGRDVGPLEVPGEALGDPGGALGIRYNVMDHRNSSGYATNGSENGSVAGCTPGRRQMRVSYGCCFSLDTQ